MFEFKNLKTQIKVYLFNRSNIYFVIKGEEICFGPPKEALVV